MDQSDAIKFVRDIELAHTPFERPCDQNQSDAIKFIRDVELAHTPFERPHDPTKDQGPTEKSPNASVSGAQLVTFADGVTAAQAADINNACLFAQLAATKKFHPEKQTKEWYEFYRLVLSNIGWVLNAFNFSKFEKAQMLGTVDKTLLTLLASSLDATGYQLFSSVLSTLAGMGPNNKPLEVFNRSCSDSNRANFQIGYAYPGGAGTVKMNLGAFTFTTSKTITNVLWFSWTHDKVDFYSSSQTLMLNEQVYSQVRDEIIKKLGDQAKLAVSSFEI